MSNLQEVARQAGVSIKTASRILQGETMGKRRDAVARAARVFDIAEKLNYRPNGAARSMRSGRFDAIGWIVSTHPNFSSIPSPLISGVQDALEEFGLHLVLSRLHDDRLTNPTAVPKLLRQLTVDGILISYESSSPPLMAALVDENRLPSVWLNVVREFNAVRPDDFNASRQATEHLLKLGHRRIAYSDFNRDVETIYHAGSHYSQRHRYEGYVSAMQSAGLSPRLLTAAYRREDTQVPRPPVPLDWLKAPDRPTAVVAYSERGLLALTLAVEAMFGSRHAISVVTFGDVVIDIDGVHFDTAIVPHAKVGYTGVNLLRRRIETPTLDIPSETIPFELVTGLSAWPV